MDENPYKSPEELSQMERQSPRLPVNDYFYALAFGSLCSVLAYPVQVSGARTEGVQVDFLRSAIAGAVGVAFAMIVGMIVHRMKW